MILARSGFSLQGGYELYYEDLDGADELWDTLLNAGADLDVRAGGKWSAFLFNQHNPRHDTF